jgi:hypothetical protein
MVLLSVRVPITTRRAIKAEAARQERSVQFVVEKLLTRFALDTVTPPATSEHNDG